MLKKLKYVFVILVFAITLIMGWFFTSYASMSDLPKLRDGDLVFQTINSPQTAAIMAASYSPYTHVGIVKIDEKGNPLVVEAVGPVRQISLSKWIEQGIGGRIAVMRMTDLTVEAAGQVIKAAEKYYGLPYDFFFFMDKTQIYCSELVYYAFNEGISIPVGKVEYIKDLDVDNLPAKKLIEQRWKYYPLCKKGDVTFEDCYNKILEEKIVTPASIADDKRFVSIYSNYLPF